MKHLSVLFSIADNLPVATRLEFYPNREAAMEEEQQKRDVLKDIQFEHGYRLGFVDSNKVDVSCFTCSTCHRQRGNYLSAQ